MARPRYHVPRTYRDVAKLAIGGPALPAPAVLNIKTVAAAIAHGERAEPPDGDGPC